MVGKDGGGDLYNLLEIGAREKRGLKDEVCYRFRASTGGLNLEKKGEVVIHI